MNFKSIRKRLVLVMALVLVVSSFGATFASTTFTDLGTAEWASPTIQKWTGYDLVAGYKDKTFRPNANITRAEFAVIAYNAFNLESNGGIEFDDVSAGDWYYSQVVGMAKLGYIKGYTDGTYQPNKSITRAEAAAIIASIQGLTANEEGSKIFLDYEAIPGWARGHVGASAMAKFITGYFDATFRANNTITRAETVAMLNNAVYGANYFANSWRVVEKGVFGGTADKPITVKGNVYIKSANVELKNVIIEGNLVFGKEIGEGDATIDNVVVKGETRVFGGGINSIYIKNSNITKLIVIKENDTIRIVAQGSTTIDSTVASSGVKLQEINLTSGEGFTVVDIEALAGLNVEFIGLFEEITIDSADVNVIIPTGTVITSLVLDKAVDVTGAGTVTTAVVSVPGITFETAPKFVEVEGTVDLDVVIGGKTQEYASGETTPTGTTPPPAAGSGGSGTPPPVTPPATTLNYNFQVQKNSEAVTLLKTLPFETTKTLDFTVINTLYESFNAIPFGYESISDLLALVNPVSTKTYAEGFVAKVSAASPTLFNTLTAQINAVKTTPNKTNIDALANGLLTLQLGTILDDLGVVYDGINVPGRVTFEFINASGVLVAHTGTVSVNGLETLINSKLNTFKLSDVSGKAVMRITLDDGQVTEKSFTLYVNYVVPN